MNPLETPLVDLAAQKIDPDLSRLVPYETMRRWRLIPFGREGNKLRVAMADPADLEAVDYVRLLTGCEVEAYAVNSEDVTEALRRCFADNSDHPVHQELLAETSPRRGALGPVEMSIGRIVDRLVQMAVQYRASDIHLEPQRGGFFVRFRVDGVLRTVHEFAKPLQSTISSHIKVLGNMDISEKRLPQDGQFTVRRGRKEIDLRVSTLPSKYGEKVVIRLLDKSSVAPELDKLGFDGAVQMAFEAMIERPHGLVLVVGPTGSGKTTTLYAVLNRVRSPEKNIITLEDPIEYELLAESANEMGVTQVQVNPKAGLTFASGLRSILRQDPDVIMVGEIRDRDTAEIAMKSAMTGHLVLSTLHTNDAPGGLMRLVDIGMEPFLVSSTVVGILAQRLVRTLCGHCKQAYAPPARALRTLFDRLDPAKATFFRTTGCGHCQDTGYRGRQGIFELLTMSETLKRALQSGARIEGLQKIAREEGMKTLRQSGLELVARGLTTVEEVLRVTAE